MESSLAENRIESYSRDLPPLNQASDGVRLAGHKGEGWSQVRLTIVPGLHANPGLLPTVGLASVHSA